MVLFVKKQQQCGIQLRCPLGVPYVQKCWNKDCMRFMCRFLRIAVIFLMFISSILSSPCGAKITHKKIEIRQKKHVTVHQTPWTLETALGCSSLDVFMSICSMNGNVCCWELRKSLRISRCLPFRPRCCRQSVRENFYSPPLRIRG